MTPNEDFLPKALYLFQTLYLFQHHWGSSGVLWVISIPNLSLRLSLERELGCALCIPDWGHSWEFPRGEQTQSHKSLASGVCF